MFADNAASDVMPAINVHNWDMLMTGMQVKSLAVKRVKRTLLQVRGLACVRSPCDNPCIMAADAQACGLQKQQ